MKYSERNSIILAVLLCILLILFSDTISDNPDEQVKAITVEGKDTLINLKK